MTHYRTNAADECNGFYHRYYRRQQANQKALEGPAGTILLVATVIGIIWLLAL